MFCVSVTHLQMSWIGVFLSFQLSSTVNRWLKKCKPCTFAGSIWSYTFTAPKSSRNIHPKLSTTLCGIIQVFFILPCAQYFQNTFLLARKLLNSTHPVRCFVSRVTLGTRVLCLPLQCLCHRSAASCSLLFTHAASAVSAAGSAASPCLVSLHRVFLWLFQLIWKCFMHFLIHLIHIEFRQKSVYLKV